MLVTSAIAVLPPWLLNSVPPKQVPDTATNCLSVSFLLPRSARRDTSSSYTASSVFFNFRSSQPLHTSRNPSSDTAPPSRSHNTTLHYCRICLLSWLPCRLSSCFPDITVPFGLCPLRSCCISAASCLFLIHHPFWVPLAKLLLPGLLWIRPSCSVSSVPVAATSSGTSYHPGFIPSTVSGTIRPNASPRIGPHVHVHLFITNFRLLHYSFHCFWICLQFLPPVRFPSQPPSPPSRPYFRPPLVPGLYLS